MPTQRATLKEIPLPIPMKLAASWTSFMFLYIYVDYLHLYKPGAVADILKGVVWKFDISETFAVSALASVAIPILMVFLSATLPARANRATNLVVAALYIPYSAFNLAGGEWLVYYGLGLLLEVIILGSILRTVWTWPRTTSTSEPVAAAAHRPHIQIGR